MSDAKTKFETLCELEKSLAFDTFSREDALALGLLLNENAKPYGEPISIEITINGLSVFRYFAEGSIQDSALWLSRKRNSVDLMSMSTLRFLYWLEMIGETLQDRKLNPDDYAAGGGGFPIRLNGTGVVGSICVSGLMQHEDDHQLIVDSVKQFLGNKKA